MSPKRRLLGMLLTVVLCLGLFAPIPASAADLYFTSINVNPFAGIKNPACWRSLLSRIHSISSGVLSPRPTSTKVPVRIRTIFCKNPLPVKRIRISCSVSSISI